MSSRLTAVNAVLLNVRSQPDGSTLDIAKRLREELQTLKKELPPDMKLAFFYDQSLIVRESVRSVWEAIVFGLILSVLILFLFLKNWRTTLVATLVIPVTVLITFVAMKLSGLSFNLMTLGGIAAAIGLVIDDAIVVVEAIHAKLSAGRDRLEAVREAVGEIVRPLIGSTLTPVVVFIPLAFLDGITGVFFRALALTMVVSLLTSLALAVTLTPSIAVRLVRPPRNLTGEQSRVEGGRLLRRVILIYERAVRGSPPPVADGGLMPYRRSRRPGVYTAVSRVNSCRPWMKADSSSTTLTPPGTSLAETHRQLSKPRTSCGSYPRLRAIPAARERAWRFRSLSRTPAIFW